MTRSEDFARDRLTVKTLSGPLNKESLLFRQGRRLEVAAARGFSAFRHESLLAQVETFAACAREQSGRLADQLEEELPVDAATAMSRVTFEVILRSVLGASAGFDREGIRIAELGLALPAASAGGASLRCWDCPWIGCPIRVSGAPQPPRAISNEPRARSSRIGARPG